MVSKARCKVQGRAASKMRLAAKFVTLEKLTKNLNSAKLRSRMKGLLSRTLLLLMPGLLSVTAQAALLQTPENIPLSMPAATVATGGIPGSTNLAGTNFLISAVVPATSRGGSASLVNQQQWANRFTNSAASIQSASYAMALRPDGSVVVTGYSDSPTNGYNFLTLCYATDGTPLWTNFYDGPNHGDDIAYYIAAGTNDDVWVAGQSMRDVNQGTNSLFTDVALICYASDGIPLWTNRYTSPDPYGDSPTGLAVDGNGNAYLTLTTTYWIPSGGYGTPTGDTVIKFDPLGNPLWTNDFPSDAPDSGKAPRDIELKGLDPAGGLIIGGMSGSGGYQTGSALLKLATDGTPVWTNYQALGFLRVFRAMQFDPQGDVIVTGARFTNYPVQYVVTKYSNATGTGLWTNIIAGPAYDDGSLPQTPVTPAGDVLVVGGASGAPFSSGFYQVIKFNSNGIPVWTNLNANFGTNSALEAATVNNAGNLYLAGHSPDPTNNSADYATIKYSSSGQPAWTNVYVGPTRSTNDPLAIMANGTGEVFVSGQSEVSSGIFESATVAYADALTYTPPTNFVGLDTISYTLTDAFGENSAGSAQVWVTSTNNFDLALLGKGLIPVGFQLGVEGAPGTNVVIIQTSTDLVHWQPLFTNAPVGGTVQYTDTSAVGFARRFYRAEQLP